jgi:hypothetical protein
MRGVFPELDLPGVIDKAHKLVFAEIFADQTGVLINELTKRLGGDRVALAKRFV